VEALLRRTAQTFAVIGALVALATGTMTVVSVLGRAMLSQPIQGDVELTQFGIALAISLGLPWCQLRRANIIVDFFTQRASERARGLLDAAGAVLLAVMCALLAWRTGVGAVSVREAHEQSMILSLPMWWAYASLAPGLALTAVIALWQAWGHVTGRLSPLAGEADALAVPPEPR
jgi:TRAP-type C4-dicarboxylate transport system permease small subunit